MCCHGPCHVHSGSHSPVACKTVRQRLSLHSTNVHAARVAKCRKDGLKNPDAVGAVGGDLPVCLPSPVQANSTGDILPCGDGAAVEDVCGKNYPINSE